MSLHAHDVTTRDGLTLNLWERPAVDGVEEMADTTEEAVLYIHGSITCARALFAPPVADDESYSWLAATAVDGRTAFALDIRGYGDSDLPPAMNKPPEENDLPVRAELAANDVADTVTVIREWYDTVHLVGVSWGTNICGRFVTRDDPAVASLVQCAPIYRTPYDVEEGLAALGLDSNLNAYYTQGRETVEAQQGDDANTELFEAIWQTQVDSNQGIDENRYIAQAGALADYADCCADDPPYDAADIDVPTFVVRGTDDAISWREGATALYDELSVPRAGAEYMEFAGADHYLMHGARRRALYETVNGFHNHI